MPETPSFAVLQDRYGEEGAAYAFERLIAQLVALEHDDARQVAAKKGDGGLDIIAGQLGGPLHVWQSKFYLTFGADRHSKVEESLERAIETAEQDGWLESWTLCFPSELGTKSTRWWEALKARHPHIDMKRWDRRELSTKLLAPTGRDVRIAFFEYGDPTRGFHVAPPTNVVATDPLELGITPAPGFVGLPPYVPRRSDKRLRQAIRDRQFLLVDGEAAAGKTRALFEAVKTVFPNAELAVPDPADLQALHARLSRLRDPLRRHELVLWLDDLDELLRPDGLTPETVKAMLRDDVRILSTIRRQPSADIRAGRGRPSAVLDLGHPFRIELRNTSKELAAFRRRFRTRRLAGGESIAQHFAAARDRVARYLSAADDTQALIAIIIDWRRTTRSPWMSREAARRVFVALRDDEDSFVQALEDAVATPNTLVLTTPTDLTVPDFLIDLDDRADGDERRRRDVTAETLSALLDVATPNDAAAIALRALGSDEQTIASKALDKARTSRNLSVQGWSLSQLGRLRADVDPDGAVDLWLEALRLGEGEAVIRVGHDLIQHAEDQYEELDEEIADRIRTAVFQSHGAETRSRRAVLLARIAESRGDLSTLAELFATTSEDAVASVGLVYARALHAAGELTRHREVIDSALDHAHEGPRGRLLLLRAELELAQDEEELAAASIAEALDICGLDVADDVTTLARRFASADHIKPVLQQLADAEDLQAQIVLRLWWPDEPDE